MRQAHTIHTHTDSCNVGDAVVVTGAVGAAVVDDALELVGVLVVGDAVVGDAVVGTADVGDGVVGTAVVGDADTGDALVGTAVVGESVVGDAVVGTTVVGDAVVGASVGESVAQQVHMRFWSDPGAAVHDTTRPDWSGMLHSPSVSAESVIATI